MKKLFVYLCASFMIFSLVGCEVLSLFSPEETKKEEAPAPPPKKPDAPSRGPSLSVKGSTSIRVSWTPKDNLAYNVYYRDRDSGPYTLEEISKTEHTYTLENLKPATKYYFHLRANNRGVLSDQSDDSAAVTDFPHVSQPTITRVNPSNIKVEWNRVSNANYHFYVADTLINASYDRADTYKTTSSLVNITSESVTITSGKTYYIGVQAVGKHSNSADNPPIKDSPLATFFFPATDPVRTYSIDSNEINMIAVNLNIANDPPDSSIIVPTRAFRIGETEVTASLWKEVADWATDSARGIQNIYTFSDLNTKGSGNQPVSNITWYQAAVFCNALTEYYNDKYGTALVPAYKDGATPIRSTNLVTQLKNGLDAVATGFRLPSSGEWELAARYLNGTSWTDVSWPSGSHTTVTKSDYLADVAVTGQTRVQSVKSRANNAIGAYDMSGNVSEWCQDDYGATTKVVRGGSYKDSATYLAVGNIRQKTVTGKYEDLGFRLAINS